MLNALQPPEFVAEADPSWITFKVNSAYKATAEAIARQDGESSMSAMLRRLIREEALRRQMADPARL